MLCFLNQFFHERTDGTKFIHQGPDAKQNLYFCCKTKPNVRKLLQKKIYCFSSGIAAKQFIHEGSALMKEVLQSTSLMKEVLQSTSLMKEVLQSNSLIKEVLQSNSFMKELLQSNSFMKEVLQSSSAVQTLVISKLNLVNQLPTTLKLSRYPCQMS